MKKNETISFLIFILSMVSIGYVIYIQSKQGVSVSGSDNVISPFLYESGVFEDTLNGLDPTSSSFHITKSELQEIKFKKMSKVLIFTIPVILFLFLLRIKPSSMNSEKIISNSRSGDIGNDFPNFTKFCSELIKDLKPQKNIDTENQIEYIFPVITFGDKILNKKWNFYVGIKKESENTFYLNCISRSGAKLTSEPKKFNTNDLSLAEYDNFFSECYLEILSNPKYHLITSNQI